jgi:hypothetical protein
MQLHLLCAESKLYTRIMCATANRYRHITAYRDGNQRHCTAYKPFHGSYDHNERAAFTGRTYARSTVKHAASRLTTILHGIVIADTSSLAVTMCALTWLHTTRSTTSKHQKQLRTVLHGTQRRNARRHKTGHHI